MFATTLTHLYSANTALTGLTRRYKNAATIVPPFINNAGVILDIAATDSTRMSRWRHLSSWGMTCEGKNIYYIDCIAPDRVERTLREHRRDNTEAS